MKTLNDEQQWRLSLEAAPDKTVKAGYPKIGDDDGISDRMMNALIVLFTLMTIGISVVASAAPSDEVKYRILLRQAMLDIDRLDYDKAIVKLLEVKANTDQNANVDHMLGLCYLYGEGSAEKAVFYLNRAMEHVSSEYETWDLDEKRAPVQTAYHLAKAYESLNNYAKAAEFYGVFLASVAESASALSERTASMINRTAEKCRTAAELVAGLQTTENVVLNK